MPPWRRPRGGAAGARPARPTAAYDTDERSKGPRPPGPRAFPRRRHPAPGPSIMAVAAPAARPFEALRARRSVPSVTAPSPRTAFVPRRPPESSPFPRKFGRWHELGLDFCEAGPVEISAFLGTTTSGSGRFEAYYRPPPGLVCNGAVTAPSPHIPPPILSAARPPPLDGGRRGWGRGRRRGYGLAAGPAPAFASESGPAAAGAAVLDLPVGANGAWSHSPLTLGLRTPHGARIDIPLDGGWPPGGAPVASRGPPGRVVAARRRLL